MSATPKHPRHMPLHSVTRPSSVPIFSDATFFPPLSLLTKTAKQRYVIDSISSLPSHLRMNNRVAPIRPIVVIVLSKAKRTYWKLSHNFTCYSNYLWWMFANRAFSGRLVQLFALDCRFVPLFQLHLTDLVVKIRLQRCYTRCQLDEICKVSTHLASFSFFSNDENIFVT